MSAHTATLHGSHISLRDHDGGVCGCFTPETALILAAALTAAAASAPLPVWAVDALADGTPIDRADGTARDLSETEALEAWRAGVALRVRS